MTKYDIEVTLPKGHSENLRLMLDGECYRHGDRVSTDAITARRMILHRRAVVAPGAVEPHSAAWHR